MPPKPMPKRKLVPTWVLAVLPFALFIGAVVVAILEPDLPRLPDPTPEELAARQEALAQRQKWAEYERAVAERNRQLCRIKNACSAFADARQECATAGDFNHCLEIKLGTEFQFISLCSTEGEFVNAPDDMPSVVSCTAIELGLRLPEF
jgi:hypothetical protein